MFVVNSEDNSIYVTRGDAGSISVSAKVDGANYVFRAGDVVRFKVVQKKACENVVLQKDFPITVDTEIVDIYLSEKDTKIGDVISKPVDYWYEVELNPFTNPQTIIGYDDDGAKIFKLHPEGRDLVDEPTTEEDVPVVDTDLSLTSSKPVENKVIARAVTNLNSNIATLEGKLAEEKKTRETQQANLQSTLTKKTSEITSDVNVLETRMNTFTALPEGSTTADSEIIDGRIDINGNEWSNIGNSIRGQVKSVKNILSQVVQPVLENVTELTITHGGYYDKSLKKFVSNENYHCVKIPVTVGEVYYTKALYGWDCPLGMVLDSNENYIKDYHSSYTQANSNFDKEMIIPENAKYLCLNSMNTTPLEVRKIKNHQLKYEPIMSFIDKVTSVNRGNNANTQNLEITTHLNHIVNEFGKFVTVNNADDNYYVLEANVSAGDTIILKGTTCFGNSLYSLYSDVGLLKKGESISGEALITTEKTVIIPIGCTKIYVNGHINFPAEIKKVVSYNNSGFDWSHLKWVCMGDSLTERNLRTTKNYHDYVADKTGINVVNLGVSGSGYKSRESLNDAFYQRTDDIPTDTDVITIFGSGNDMGVTLGSPTDTGTDTLCGCINATIDNIYSRLPTVQLGIVSPCPWGSYPPNVSNNKMLLYSEALKEICKMRSIPFLDLYHVSGLRPWESSFLNVAYTKDGGNSVHPDETGHKMIASQFYNFLQSLVGVY